MRVAIAGAGNVGQFVAADLRAAGHDVVLIERDEDVVRGGDDLTEQGITWYVGDACEVTSLRGANLSNADVVVAATGDDEDNLVVSLLAKQEFAVPRVIARVNHPGNTWLFTEAWGVDVPVSTPQIVTALVEEAVTVGSLVRLFHLEGGQVRLVEVTLAADSPAVGRHIADLAVDRDVTFVAIVRGERVVHPRGETVLAAGDEVLALVTAETEIDVRRALTARDGEG